ncbi:zinc-dependent metalloprotease [Rhabdothermincola sediminis]|uniref:zinc-dependent metalloprotease n=1 Tax=Rhabdothermincola sediminis TaxID=2751370 RepID=UPI001AA0180B|nr:zinc-dependent metalloprotease [Rhabdothermincola sediminis]
MSGSRDDSPFGSGDPFRGLPIFGDLARLFQQQGPVAWEAARQLAVSIATGGEPEPNVDPIDRISIEQLARVAELHVADATGLPTSVTGTGLAIVPVTRAQWALRTLEAYRPLFEELAGSLDHEHHEPATDPIETGDPMAWMAPLMQMIGPMMLGMTAGSMVGHLARRAFGQYELPIPRPASDELMVVPANLDAFGDAWSLQRDDLRLWVCLSEVAHHAVLGVRHVRSRLEELLHQYLSGFEGSEGGIEERLGGLELSDPSQLGELQALFSDPEVLLGAIQSPAQRAMLPQLEALLAAIVGYVDHVMDEVGAKLIADYHRLTEALRRHRVEARPSDRFVERLFGLELTQAQYERGERFVEGVLERAGPSGLARLWESERTLPTPAEIDAPGLWLARIELPDAN